MPDDILIVPVVLPGGSLHFSSIAKDGTVQDVINSLTTIEEVLSDVLGELQPSGWCIQHIRQEQHGRQWEEEELEALGDDILDPSVEVAPVVNETSSRPSLDRHFSSFALTSHLHTPVLRLVSMHPSLSLTVTFIRVPEIHDGFEWTCFFARSSTVHDVIELIVQTLGLTKSLPIPGGGTLDYVLEEVWSEGDTEKASRIPASSVISTIVGSTTSPSGFSKRATRRFHFAVPDEWYRRSNSRSISSTSTEPSESTIKALRDMEESEDNEEGTAKQKDKPPSSTPSKGDNADWRNTLSQNRISSIFEGWLRPSTPTSPSKLDIVGSPERLSVSEPTLVQHSTGNGNRSSVILDDDTQPEGELDSAEFEEMLDELGLKESRRQAMYDLPLDRRRYLLEQHKQFRTAVSAKPRTHSHQPSYSATVGPSSGSSMLPRLVPQLTGDVMKRFSISGWGAGVATPAVVSPDMSTNSGELHSGVVDVKGMARASIEKAVEESQPLQPQSTGGLWSSWWSSSGGEKRSSGSGKSTGTKDTKTPVWYADGIRNGRTTDAKLVKHLISLRVHLSTANLAWIQEFIADEKGAEVLGSVLASLVGKGGKRKSLGDTESTVLLEIVKCFRVLLNTEIGFSEVLASPTIVTYIAYSLHGSSTKLRSLVSDLLAALCILALPEGHRAVLAALSDYRVAFDEAFRFEELIASLRPPESDLDAPIATATIDSEPDGAWEARTASMVLVNALTNCPEALEDRVTLREEFGRRGLNEVIVTLRYIKPPDSLITQLDVYTEEKFEDEEDMRERALALMKSGYNRSTSDSEIALDELVRLARLHTSYPKIVDTLNGYVAILGSEHEAEYVDQLVDIMAVFIQNIVKIENVANDWTSFMSNFADAVQHITGQRLTIQETSSTDPLIAVERELETLRNQIEELVNERSTLRDQVDQQAAEINTLRSLTNFTAPQGKAPGKAGQENFHGIVQRLVQKERQVLQLQSEVDKLKAQNPGELRDADERAKRERDKAKWNNLMDEIAKLKIKLNDTEQSFVLKDKEVIYLKRALESVYSRFRTREESREAETDAQLIAAKAIESWTRRDEEITVLRSEVAELKAALAAKPQFSNEKDFKSKVPPPPPPPPKPTRKPTSQNESTSSPPPPPPPPPPPRLDSSAPSPSPPPPPPPPPPPAPSTPLASPPASASSPPPPPPPPPPPMSPSATVMTGGAPPPPPPPPPPMRSPGGRGAPPPSAFRMGKTNNAPPAKRLRPFFWNKLQTPSLASTVWNDVSLDFSIAMDDLESAFSMDNAESSSPQVSQTRSRKQSVTTLLDITRANNIAIMLSRVKMGVSDIRKALLDVNDEALSVDDLKAIGRQLPTVEEIARLKDFEDVSKLAKSDQYFYQIMDIPRLAERLDCMIYRRRLELDIEELRPELDIVRNAARELKSSLRFKRVLQAVLSIGNALNGSSFRGRAQGFKLDALVKMRETKTVKGGPDCPTLLHYLARALLRTDPSLVTFVEDMPHLEAAARVSVQTLAASITALVNGLDHINAEIRNSRASRALPQDHFVNVMTPFVRQNSASVEAMKHMGSAIEVELRSLLAYYGETPESPEAPKPEDFFALILSFSSSLQKAALEVHDKQPALPATPVIVEEPAAEEDSSEPTVKGDPHGLPPSARSSQGRAGGLSVGRGDLDQAIRSMRTGKRRARPNRPLSKIFFDGGRPQSRVFDA